jgi:hypothetical protein
MSQPTTYWFVDNDSHLEAYSYLWNRHGLAVNVHQVASLDGRILVAEYDLERLWTMKGALQAPNQ